MSPAHPTEPPGERERPLTLALTLGDPNGIGPEVVLKAARALTGEPGLRLVAVGSAAVLADQAARLGLGAVHRVTAPGETAPEDALAVLDPTPLGESPAYTWGAVSAEGGAQAMRAVAAAADGCLAGAFDAMVTAPLSKEAIHRAGFPFPGHTEFLAERTGAGHVVMVLAAGALRVALVTIHLPLADVPRAVTAGAIGATLDTLDAGLRRDWGVPAPRLAVLGLNPHAGDGGVLGREEITTIAPAIEAARARGLDVSGPHPADGFFGRRGYERADAVVAMYHDQGLAPFKALAMGGGVNVTLGLPLVRTSPDHGTAFDLAGQGRADAASMTEAVRLAAAMARLRRPA